LRYCCRCRTSFGLVLFSGERRHWDRSREGSRPDGSHLPRLATFASGETPSPRDALRPVAVRRREYVVSKPWVSLLTVSANVSMKLSVIVSIPGVKVEVLLLNFLRSYYLLLAYRPPSSRRHRHSSLARIEVMTRKEVLVPLLGATLMAICRYPVIQF